MLELRGKYGEAKVFTDNIEEKAVGQIIGLLNQRAFQGCSIRIMPDCHVGSSCVVGFTGYLSGKIIPSIVGVDIGCGMFVVNLGKRDIDYKLLDDFIRKEIPYGMRVNKKPIKLTDRELRDGISDIAVKTGSNVQRHMKSIGSLGGGNHFIEVCRNLEEEYILVIHSGSRNFGNETAKYHKNKAIRYCKRKVKELRDERDLLMEDKEESERKKIKEEFQKRIDVYNVPAEYAFLELEDGESYMYDMRIAQKFASLNRKIMAERIVKFLNLDYKRLEKFETVHNYIDFEDGIIRKGAISAKEGEKVIIPINMKDGSIIAVGKGNPLWNQSAPHGAGRLYSRGHSKDKFTLEEFQKEMEGVWTTSVSRSTLDESPMAYKPMEEIVANIEGTVDILERIKPVYNFKSPN